MNIRPLTPGEIPAAAHLLAEAFLRDPAYTHIIRCQKRRRRFPEKMMALRLRFALGHGTVLTTDDGLGLISCQPPQVSLSLWDILTLGGLWAALYCNPRDLLRLLRFMGYTGQWEKRAASRQPGWLIGPLAVSPAAQGRGYGSALLGHVLKEVIPAGEAALLETQSVKNQRYYQKFGFCTLEETVVPCTQVPNIIMCRAGA